MSIRPFMKINSADDVRATADRLGSHFFDADTMRGFSSRLLNHWSPVTDGPSGENREEIGYIVTSERDTMRNTPREYAVRRISVRKVTRDNGYIIDEFDIDTIVRFLKPEQAKAAAHNLAVLEYGGPGLLTEYLHSVRELWFPNEWDVPYIDGVRVFPHENKEVKA